MSPGIAECLLGRDQNCPRLRTSDLCLLPFFFRNDSVSKFFFFFFSVRRLTQFHRLIPLEVSFMPPFSSFSWSSISPIQTCQRYLYLFPAPPFHDIDNMDCVHYFPKYDRKVVTFPMAHNRPVTARSAELREVS